MRVKFALACLFLASALSSCYTNVNQLWFKGKREYSVSWLDYNSHASSGQAMGLQPVLYRCGDAWYIAARHSKVRDAYPYSCVQWVGLDYEERHGFFGDPSAAVFYHKISPQMASMLQQTDESVWNWFNVKRMKLDMKNAGGGWVPALPEGAKAVSAPFLKKCQSSLLLIEERNDARWYAYPAAALTFLCVDVPCSVFTLAFGPMYDFYESDMYYPSTEDDDVGDFYIGFAAEYDSDPLPVRGQQPPPPPVKGHGHHPAPGKGRPSGGHHSSGGFTHGGRPGRPAGDRPGRPRHSGASHHGGGHGRHHASSGGHGHGGSHSRPDSSKRSSDSHKRSSDSHKRDESKR